jgi:TatD DNase family protein
MLIDTHAHLDALEFGSNALAQVSLARELGVAWIIVPAVSPENFDTVRVLANRASGVAYALGIHPLFVPGCTEQALTQLHDALSIHRQDPLLLAVGEIGLDYFAEPRDEARQLHFFKAQLQMAKEFDLPVILHSRRAVDHIARECRRSGVNKGIAHAFNGSQQQAQALISVGLVLGFGGAMTYSRALQIRRLAEHLPLESMVLETDAPDISPEWLAREFPGQVNAPHQLPRIAQTLAAIRHTELQTIARQTSLNACAALPKLNALVFPAPCNP